MSLDIWAIRNVANKDEILSLIAEDSLKNEIESVLTREIFSKNITHNLNKMAASAGFYRELWHLDNIKTCSDLLPFIESGVNELKAKPNVYQQYSASNGWGTYEQFIPWLEELTELLKISPDAELGVSR